jgi:CHAD domain-containing protein
MSKRKPATWEPGVAAEANARRVLPGLAGEYFAQVRRTLAENPAPADLHRVRLATKRRRYTLELFRPCYGPGLATRLAALRVVQQLLGEVNDCVTAAKLLPRRMRARDFVERRSAEKAAEFRKNWTEVFDAAGRERLWVGFLKRRVRKT